MQKRSLCALAMIVAGAAAAQNAPPTEYRSAFADYRGYKEPQIADWRAANEAVRRAGGHLGIVRSQGEATKAAPQPPAHGAGHK